MRKGFAAVIFLLHPLVANIAFKAVYCVANAKKEWIVAAAPTVMCDSVEHVPVYILSMLAIAVSIIGYPLYATIVLTRSAGWCGKIKEKNAEEEEEERHEGDDDGKGAVEGIVVANAHGAEGSQARGDAEASGDDDDNVKHLETLDDNEEEDDVADDLLNGRPGPLNDNVNHLETFDDDKEDVADDPLHGPGPLSRALLMRSARCVGFMKKTRKTVNERHNKYSFPQRHHAWASFLFSDYKPEFFILRLVFFHAITALAFANTVRIHLYTCVLSTLTVVTSFAHTSLRSLLETVCSLSFLFLCLLLLLSLFFTVPER